MNIPFEVKVHKLSNIEFKTKRTPEGVVEIWADTFSDLMFAKGYVHAHDRKLQMLLLRLIGKGKLSRIIKSDPETNEIDKFMIEMGFYEEAQEDANNLSGDYLTFLQRFCDGVNEGIQEHKIPFELKIFGYRFKPWTIADSLMVVKIMSYIGLAQTQQEIEKIIIQSINNGVCLEKLKSLFRPHLDEISELHLQYIKELNLFQNIVPNSIKFFECNSKNSSK